MHQTYLHKASTLNFIIACIVAFGTDHLFRVLKTRVATAHLRALPDLDMTRVEIPALNAGWRAGQHVRLRVLSTAMGWASWLEVHPFTIASVSKTEEGMVLMVKKTGGWTRKMYEVAKTSGYGGDGLGRDMKVVVEGPYGKLFGVFSSPLRRSLISPLFLQAVPAMSSCLASPLLSSSPGEVGLRSHSPPSKTSCKGTSRVRAESRSSSSYG